MPNSIKFGSTIILKQLSSAPSNPALGEMYFDTSENKIKIYDGSSWSNLGGDDSSEFIQNINNNQSAPANITGAVLSSNAKGIKADYLIERSIEGASIGSGLEIDANKTSKIAKYDAWGGLIKDVKFFNNKFYFGGYIKNYKFKGKNFFIRTGLDFNTDDEFVNNLSFQSDPANVNSIAIDTNLNKILIGGAFTFYGSVSGRNGLVRLNLDGTQDNTFNSNASDGNKFNINSGYQIDCITIQPDGKYLIGGNFNNYGGVNGRNKLIRLNPDGTLDATFTNNASGGAKFGSSTGRVLKILVQSDGKILVYGDFYDYNGINGKSRLIRLNSDGTLDTTFNIPNNLLVFTIDLQSDNKILICGAFQDYGGVVGRSRLVRLNSDGTVDTVFTANAVDGGKFTDQVSFVKELSDGKILVSGEFYNYNNTYNRMIVLNNDGTLNYTFSNYISNFLNNKNIVVTSNIEAVAEVNNKIYLVGDFYCDNSIVNGSYRFIVLNSDGTINEDEIFALNSFYSYLYFLFYANNINIKCKYRSNGKIIIYGNLTYIFDFQFKVYNSIVQFNADGTFDTAFNDNISLFKFYNSTIYDVEILPDDKIIVVGDFLDYNSQPNLNYIIMFNQDGTVNTSFGDTLRNNLAANKIVSIKFYNNNYYLLTALGPPGFEEYSLLKVNMTESIVDQFSMGIQADLSLSINNNYAYVWGNLNIPFPVPINNLARLSLNPFAIDTSFSNNTGPVATVKSIDFDSNNNIYVITQSVSGLSKFNSNGQPDTTFSSNFNGALLNGAPPLVLKIYNDKIFVGGGFISYGSEPYNRMLVLNLDGTLNNDYSLFKDFKFFNQYAPNGVFSMAINENNGDLLVINDSYMTENLGSLIIFKAGSVYSLQNHNEFGTLYAVKNGNTWLTQKNGAGNSGVNFVINSTNQIQYTSSNLTGNNHAGQILLKIKEQFT